MIYCANNNTLYPRAADLCKDLNINKSTVSRVLAGKGTRAGVYLIAELDDTSPEAISAARTWLLYSVYKITGCEAAAYPTIYGEEVAI